MDEEMDNWSRPVYYNNEQKEGTLTKTNAAKVLHSIMHTWFEKYDRQSLRIKIKYMYLYDGQSTNALCTHE